MKRILAVLFAWWAFWAFDPETHLFVGIGPFPDWGTCASFARVINRSPERAQNYVGCRDYTLVPNNTGFRG
jgi:hypothetical protein